MGEGCIAPQAGPACSESRLQTVRVRRPKAVLRTGCCVRCLFGVPCVLSLSLQSDQRLRLMHRASYLWRQLNPKQRERWLAWRQRNRQPWHLPPHRFGVGGTEYHITAACFEHRPHIGLTADRLSEFSVELLSLANSPGCRLSAWCVLPNHYHLLLEASDCRLFLREVGRLHGCLACTWNRAELTPGRQVFHGCVERAIRSDRHHWATLNYIHHNPVHHRYTDSWTEWPWSSAGAYLKNVGRKNALRIWREYPVEEYGKGWDAPEL
jgi:putative transposase